MSLVEVLHADATCLIGAVRNLQVYTWHAAPTVAQIRECIRVARFMARKHPAGTGLLNLMVEGTPSFGDDVRAETAKLIGDPTVTTLGVADVVLLTGFAGVAVRGFLSTVTLLARGARPQKVFGEVGPAAAWLAPKLSIGEQRWAASEILTVAAEATPRRA